MYLKKFALALVTAAGLASGAVASSLPAISDNYEGKYDIVNAFGGHGLWLRNFLGDNTWSVVNGSAVYENNSLALSGQVENGGYKLDFDFQLTEVAHAGDPYCGNGHACQAITQEMKDNMVYFNQGANLTMGTVTGAIGTALEGLTLEIVMRALPDKPGQLGYGGNWTNLDFGYSNWFDWSITENNTNVQFANLSGIGDVNLDLTPMPVPAGLPLLLTGFAGFAMLRRRARA